MGDADENTPLGWFDPRGAATLRAAWEGSPALIAVVVGEHHSLAFQNGASRARFGSKRLGTPLVDAFPEVGRGAGAALDIVRSTGEPLEFPRRTVAVRDLAGDDVVLSYVFSPLGPTVPADGVVIHAVDVTAEVRAAEAADRARLLAEVSSSVANAPTTAGALQAFVDGLVPPLADFAAFYVAETTSNLGSDPAPPTVIALAEALTPAGPPPATPRRDEPSPWEAILHAGDPVIIPVTTDTFEAVAPDPRAAAWLRATRGHSIAVLPMVAAGQLTGALLLMAAGDRPGYRPGDLPFLTGIAARAGAALAQQYQHRRQQDIALQLQRALLPHEPDDVPGLELAARYVAGAPGVDVGGDWWDVQHLGGGRVALGIGDVSGRGVAAAAVMGQARAAMRAAGYAQLSPGEVLTVLDALIADLTIPDRITEPIPPRFATACYAVVDPARDLLTLANAGHTPVICRSADGDVTVIEVPPGAPLGLLAGGFSEHDVPFHPGDLIAMFTDGLVESLDLDLDHGLAALADALAKANEHDALIVVLKQVLDAMSTQPGYGNDDMALLLARRVR